MLPLYFLLAAIFAYWIFIWYLLESHDHSNLQRSFAPDLNYIHQLEQDWTSNTLTDLVLSDESGCPPGFPHEVVY